MTTSRLTKLTDSLKASGLDALVLNPGPSLVYLTGLHFHLMERPVVAIFAADGRIAVVLPELEMLKLEGYPAEGFAYGENPAGWDGVFRAALQSLGLDGKRLGVEPRQMRLLEFRYVEAAVGATSRRPTSRRPEFPDASDAVSRLRVRKDAEEVAAMRRAVRIAQAALQATLPLIKVGMSERELSGELVIQLLRNGSQPELAFSPIVSSGPNGANPHAVPSDRKLQPGDLLVVDWGALSDGYISDLTRTFAVGEVEAEFAKIHKIVQEANAAGRAAGKPGLPCAAVDLAARTVIEKSGYGAFFTHRTGHGIGMEGHEDPYMRGDNQQLLEPGMAYTVEPGIYLPGRNGVRIEDDVVVTESGAESLSDMPRELRVVG
jgi:Xaa-Pro dipeptidase